jgi:carboxymethylenebutenolidase
MGTAATAGNGSVGVLGYCLGGGLSYITSAIHDIDCAVSYYAVGLQERLDLASDVDAPLLLHLAENDHHCPPEARADIIGTLSRMRNVETYLYEGAGHAFATYGRATFQARATEAAWQRTIKFLHRWLSRPETDSHRMQEAKLDGS